VSPRMSKGCFPGPSALGSSHLSVSQRQLCMVFTAVPLVGETRIHFAVQLKLSGEDESAIGMCGALLALMRLHAFPCFPRFDDIAGTCREQIWMDLPSAA